MHEIAALVVSERDAEKVMVVWTGLRPGLQAHGVCVLPLRPFLLGGGAVAAAVPDLEAPNIASALREFLAPLLGALRSAGLLDPFCVIFTQYWGGVGTQAAVSVTHRGMISSLTIGEDAINGALGQLGVDSQLAEDAFQRLGLHMWRQESV